jgi:hypothetical protein
MDIHANVNEAVRTLLMPRKRSLLSCRIERLLWVGSGLRNESAVGREWPLAAPTDVGFLLRTKCCRLWKEQALLSVVTMLTIQSLEGSRRTTNFLASYVDTQR